LFYNRGNRVDQNVGTDTKSIFLLIKLHRIYIFCRLLFLIVYITFLNFKIRLDCVMIIQVECMNQEAETVNNRWSESFS